MLRKLITKVNNILNGTHEYSYRSEAGVKVNVTEHCGAFGISVDLDDDQTKEVMRGRLEEFSKYDVVNGKLVKNGRF